jgi:hypothetical protein
MHFLAAARPIAQLARDRGTSRRTIIRVIAEKAVEVEGA